MPADETSRPALTTPAPRRTDAGRTASNVVHLHGNLIAKRQDAVVPDRRLHLSVNVANGMGAGIAGREPDAATRAGLRVALPV